MLHRFSSLALSLATLLSAGYGQSPLQSVEELASALLDAISNQQRAGLLEANNRLVTAELEKTVFGEGVKFHGQRKWEQALSAYSAARSVASLIDDKSGAALALHEIGRVYFNQGRFEESLDYFQQSLTLRKELGDKTNIARSMFSRVSDGEGMIGPAWSLFVAGSPSTVVSQWKVDAASTTGLMLEFHRNLRANNSKADALRKATLRLLQNTRYKHPFYWAPFVIVGNAK